MTTKAAAKRLGKEYASMQKEPPPFVWAVPDEKNILTWNYIIRGPPDSPYAGGEYHGVLLFPPEYPFKPPGIKMLTPSGRFQTDKRICFSMSDFHPGSWNPAWSVATILTGLLSFMLSDEMTTGGLSSSIYDKRTLAAKSHTWNISQKRFKDAFPDHCAPSMKNLPNMGEKERGKPDEAAATPLPVDVKETVTSASRLTSAFTLPTPGQVPLPAPKLNGNASLPQTPAPAANGHGHGLLGTWAAEWRNVIWEKWRWGALIALAVVVSRLSS
ncbi:UBC-like protein [Gautieria morchelliformis]|nr:UBC-like protein [Gautieria morchelliformis]